MKELISIIIAAILSSTAGISHFSCDVQGCTIDGEHVHSYCDVHDCTIEGEHEHSYCDVYGCTIEGEHEHGSCGIAGCTRAGEHSHGGGCHNSGHHSGRSRGHH